MWRRAVERAALPADLLADHRVLRDIGATPYDVWTEARKPFWRR